MRARKRTWNSPATKASVAPVEMQDADQIAVTRRQPGPGGEGDRRRGRRDDQAGGKKTAISWAMKPARSISLSQKLWSSTVASILAALSA